MQPGNSALMKELSEPAKRHLTVGRTPSQYKARWTPCWLRNCRFARLLHRM